jgi:hypothetical protein
MGGLTREMGGKVGRWVANWGDGWLSIGIGWLRRKMNG